MFYNPPPQEAGIPGTLKCYNPRCELYGILFKVPSVELERARENIPSVQTCKPPLGVCPEWVINEDRIKELAAAINRYVTGGFYGAGYGENIIGWCDELTRRLKTNIV